MLNESQTISEYIAMLEKLKELHGDVKVIGMYDGDFLTPEPPEYSLVFGAVLIGTRS